MKPALGYLAAAVAGALAMALCLRACETQPPVPVLAPEEVAAYDAERDAALADADRRESEAQAEAERLAGLDLYERIGALVPPRVMRDPDKLAGSAYKPGAVSESPRRPASVSESAGAPGFDKDPAPGAVSKPERCEPTGDGRALCPEWVLDRLSLLVVEERLRADVAEVRLDESRKIHAIDADEWAAKEGRYLAALADAKPPPAWKVPVAIASGGAIVGGLVLAASGHPEAGLAVAGAGAVGAVVAAW